MNRTRILTTGIFIIGCQLIIALVGVASLRLYTALVPPEVFGEANLLLSGLGLGLQLFVAGLTAVLLRFYSEAKETSQSDQFISEIMRWALGATSLLGLLIVLSCVVNDLFGKSSLGLAVVVGGITWLFATTVRNVIMGVIQAERRQKLYAKLQVVESVLLLGATAISTAIHPQVSAYMIGQAIGIACLLIVIYAFERRIYKRAFTRTEATPGFLRRIRTYGLAFVPLSILSWLANLGDRYTLAFLLGTQAVGRYVAPFSIASRGMLLANVALSDLFRPILFEAANRRESGLARKTVMTWLASSLAISAGGLAVILGAGSWVARLLLAPEYRTQAVPIMLWVSLGYAFSGITQVVECWLLSLGYAGRLMLPMAFGALANIAFSFILIPRSGVVGAAQATCASFIFQNGATWLMLLHVSGGNGSAWPGRVSSEVV